MNQRLSTYYYFMFFYHLSLFIVYYTSTTNRTIANYKYCTTEWYVLCTYMTNVYL